MDSRQELCSGIRLRRPVIHELSWDAVLIVGPEEVVGMTEQARFSVSGLGVVFLDLGVLEGVSLELGRMARLGCVRAEVLGPDWRRTDFGIFGGLSGFYD